MPARGYAPAPIMIVDPLAPAAPTNLVAQPGAENSLLLSWSPNNEPDLRGYQIRLRPTGDTNAEEATIDAGNTNLFRIAGLSNSTPYLISVLAYDQTIESNTGNPPTPHVVSRLSLPSQPVTATTGVAVLPAVRVTSPQGGESVEVNNSLTVSWTVENADDLYDQQVELSRDGGKTFQPLARRLPPAQRNFVWDIPAVLQGTQFRIKVSALDQSGNEGSDAGDANFSILPTDRDGDGLSDDFELANGFNPDVPGEQLGDPDADLFNNLAEFRAGTNPRDAQSALRLESALPGPDGLAVSFRSVRGRNYQVERTDDLSGGWVAVGEVLRGDGTVLQVTDPEGTGGAARFYRVRLLL